MVGVDGSEQSRFAVDWAVREAKARDAVLRLICVAPIGNENAPQWIAHDALQQSSEVVDDAVELATSLDPTVALRGDVLQGPSAKLLVEASEVADLLVLGARGRGALGEFLLGSVSQKCAQRARCPVVVVHTPPGNDAVHSRPRIVVEVDERGGSRRALQWAREEAALRSAQVEVVSAGAGLPDIDPPDNGAQLAPPHAQHRGRGHFLRPEPAECARLAACQGADLLVVEEPGHKAVHDRLVGSLSHRRMHETPCPVVVMGPATLS